MAARTHLNSVNSKINKAMRIISFKAKDHPTTTLFKNLKVLPLFESIEMKQAQFIWKLMHGLLPLGISYNLNFNEWTQFSNSLSRLESYKNFILFVGHTL